TRIPRPAPGARSGPPGVPTTWPIRGCSARRASNGGGLSPSTQRLVEDIRRRLEAERLSRPGVQLGCDLVEPGLADQVEVGPFRQVLAKETVRVLVRAALPGATRVAEVELDVGGDGELGVLGHLQAAIPGQRGAQLVR